MHRIIDSAALGVDAGLQLGSGSRLGSLPSEVCQILTAVSWPVGQPRQDLPEIGPHFDFVALAGYHHRRQRRQLWPGFLDAHVQPVLAAKGDRAHGVLSHVVVYLYLPVFKDR